jgi:outer membrane protein insertion porin family
VLTGFYQSRGYVDFQGENVDVSLTRERDATITFNVQKGSSSNLAIFFLSHPEVTSADPAIYEDALRLRTGVTYSPELIERDIARLELWLCARTDFVRVDPRSHPQRPHVDAGC